jgi:hypothetical protein
MMIMRTQTICFPEQQVLCVFPDKPANLEQAISTLGLKDGYPVIVLIGGNILEQQEAMTQRAIQTLSQIAEDTNWLSVEAQIWVLWLKSARHASEMVTNFH